MAALNSAMLAAAGLDTLLAGSTLAQATAIRAGIRASRDTIVPQLKRFRRAKARAAIGAGIGRVIAYGDSTTRTPYESGSVASKTGAYIDRLAARFRAAGYNVTTNALYGMNGMTTAAFSAYDPRVTFGAGWGPSANLTLGGEMFSNTTSTNALSVAFADPFDTIVVRYRQQTTAGQFTVDVGGAVLQTITTTGTDGMQTVVISTGASASVGVVNIKRVSGTVEIVGLEAYDSAKPGLIFINAGRGGWNSNNWNFFGLTWRPGEALKTIAPDLLIDGNAGVNDVNNNGDPSTPTNPLTTFINNKQTMINQIASVSDIILHTLDPQDVVFSTLANQELFRQAVITLGITNNLPVFDILPRWISRADASNWGLYGDGRHPSLLGHDDFAAAEFELLRA